MSAVSSDPPAAGLPNLVRPATSRDAPEILALIRELAEFEHLAHTMACTEADLHAHCFGPRPAAEALMAESAGSVVGFALFFTTFSTFLGRPGIYLEDLYVRPAFRRQGHGRRLLLSVAALARERRCGRLEWAVLDWNAAAIAFYTRIGAVALDDWTTFRLAGPALAGCPPPGP